MRNFFIFLIILLITVLTAACLAGENQGMSLQVKTDEIKHVRLGIDNVDDHLKVFAGKRIGLITNATGYNSALVSSIKVLKEKTNLVALYAPEHGVRGNIWAGETVDNYIDADSGLMVYSLYGKNKKPSPEILAGVDALAFDIQDVGARFYTYIYTMAYAMQACAEQGKEFIVFDRPNPVGGLIVEGGLVQTGYESFIGMYKIPIRHGMTVGELAKLFNEEFGIHCKLTVIPMSNWHRSMFWSDTGLHWLNTSPNIPSADAALVYSGTGILGDAGISVGIGTTRPFEYVGLQSMNSDYVIDKLNTMNLPGVVFLPVYFTPRYTDGAVRNYSGLQLIVTDKSKYLAVRTAMAIFYTIKQFYHGELSILSSSVNDNKKPSIDLSSGSNWLRTGVYSYDELMSLWDQEAASFKEMSKKYYLYD